MAHFHTVQLPLIPESGILVEIPFSAEDDPRGEELWQPIVKSVLRQLACYNRCVANIAPTGKDDHWSASAKDFAINKKITEIVQNAAAAVESQTKDLSSAVRELYDAVELEDSNFQNGSWARLTAGDLYCKLGSFDIVDIDDFVFKIQRRFAEAKSYSQRSCWPSSRYNDPFAIAMGNTYSVEDKLEVLAEE